MALRITVALFRDCIENDAVESINQSASGEFEDALLTEPDELQRQIAGLFDLARAAMEQPGSANARDWPAQS